VEVHCTALGKAMLAYLRDEYVDSVSDRHGLEARTERRITDREELAAELDRVRGYVISVGERIHGLGVSPFPIRETVEGKSSAP